MIATTRPSRAVPSAEPERQLETWPPFNPPNKADYLRRLLRERGGRKGRLAAAMLSRSTDVAELARQCQRLGIGVPAEIGTAGTGFGTACRPEQ